MDLAPARALTLRSAAAEVASGRVDLLAADPLPGWRRLRRIPGVGPWTLEALALYGQGRHDRVPAGDLGYLKLVGRVTTGNPKARVDVPAVRAFFEPLRRLEGAGRRVPAPRRRARPPAGQSCDSRPGSSPSPARNSFVTACSATCRRVIRPASSIQSA